MLECIPPSLAAGITSELDIPTIGIGAGPHCSGQVCRWPPVQLLLLGTRWLAEHADKAAIVCCVHRSA